jgi:hypothetical protein
MKKRTSKRLLLSTERVQTLEPPTLRDVVGGQTCVLTCAEHCVTSKNPVGGGR